MNRQSVHRDVGGKEAYRERVQRLDRWQSQTEGILVGSLGHTSRDRHCTESQVTATGMFQVDSGQRASSWGVRGLADEVCCKLESGFMYKENSNI